MDKEKEDCFDMELKMSPLLSGEATMLVYYVTQSLEFIADFTKFSVDECFQNEVSDYVTPFMLFIHMYYLCLDSSYKIFKLVI